MNFRLYILLKELKNARRIICWCTRISDWPISRVITGKRPLHVGIFWLAVRRTQRRTWAQAFVAVTKRCDQSKRSSRSPRFFGILIYTNSKMPIHARLTKATIHAHKCSYAFHAKTETIFYSVVWMASEWLLDIIDADIILHVHTHDTVKNASNPL